MQVFDICPQSCGFCEGGKHFGKRGIAEHESEIKSPPGKEELNADGAMSNDSRTMSTVAVVAAIVAVGLIAIVVLALRARTHARGLEIDTITPNVAEL